MRAGREATSSRVSRTASILINGRFLTQAQRGVQRFATQVVTAIDQVLDETQYTPLRGKIELLAPGSARDFPLKNIPLRYCGVTRGYVWEQLEYPFFVGRRLALNLCVLGPAVKTNQIIVVHDATVRAMPSNFSWSFRVAHNLLVPKLLHSSKIVTVSEFSRREIGRFYGVNIEEVPVCYEGGDHITFPAADIGILERSGVGKRPYFLGVGADSPNKNIEAVLKAFAQANLEDVQLVLTGSSKRNVHGYSLEISDPRVRIQSHVTDSELRALYENALALVYPSRYEGFGLPPLEAMMCGCPVITSDQEALAEVGSNATLRCNPDDIDAIAEFMRDIHENPALRGYLSAAGRDRASQFTWANTARHLLELCNEMIAVSPDR